MDSINNNIVFNTIDNGIIILNEDLEILAWNNWLEIRTHINSQDIIHKNMCKTFPYINEKKLKRKIKSVLITNNPSFYTVDPHRYLIKIKSNTIVNKVYDYMQQDVTIVPYDLEKKLVCLYIYDNTKFCETNYKLEQLNSELKELSYRDPMTQAHNRRYFYEQSSKMLSLAKRDKHDLCVIILDIDKFKAINDNYGHSVGDDVIIMLANSLQEHVRTSDVVARFGGEEFVILLYNSNLSDAQIVAEKIRDDVKSLQIKINDEETLKFTVSLGVAQYSDNLDTHDIEHTITRADKCLYVAKESGRDKTISEEFLGASKLNANFNRADIKYKQKDATTIHIIS